MAPKLKTKGKTKSKKVAKLFMLKYSKFKDGEIKDSGIKEELVLHIKRGDARSQVFMKCFEHEGIKYALDRFEYTKENDWTMDNTCNHSFYILTETNY
jgi:hypothetical protein